MKREEGGSGVTRDELRKLKRETKRNRTARGTKTQVTVS